MERKSSSARSPTVWLHRRSLFTTHNLSFSCQHRSDCDRFTYSRCLRSNFVVNQLSLLLTTFRYDQDETEFLVFCRQKRRSKMFSKMGTWWILDIDDFHAHTTNNFDVYEWYRYSPAKNDNQRQTVFYFPFIYLHNAPLT